METSARIAVIVILTLISFVFLSGAMLIYDCKYQGIFPGLPQVVFPYDWPAYLLFLMAAVPAWWGTFFWLPEVKK